MSDTANTPAAPYDVEADRKIINAATEGPWYDNDTGGEDARAVWNTTGDPCDHKDHVLICSRHPAFHSANVSGDMKFIAAARTRWPAAVAEVERLQAENDRLRSALQRIIDRWDCRSELYTSDAECAGVLRDTANLALLGVDEPKMSRPAETETK